MSWHGCMYIVHCIILYIIHCIPDFGPEAPGKDGKNQEQGEDQQDDCNLRWNQKLRNPAWHLWKILFLPSPRSFHSPPVPPSLSLCCVFSKCLTACTANGSAEREISNLWVMKVIRRSKDQSKIRLLQIVLTWSRLLSTSSNGVSSLAVTGVGLGLQDGMLHQRGVHIMEGKTKRIAKYL